ncbi:MAG TPA: TonB family protein [Puia sp.]|nr:TonB family protein [Puia sp.]
MDINKILNADILDIIFDGRNKDYGAYELRKSYNRRLKVAIISTVSLCVLLLGGFFLAGAIGNGPKKQNMHVEDVELETVKEQKKEEPPPPPPPPKEPPKVELTKFTPPKIVKDEEVKKEDKPPEQEKLEDTKISNINQEGQKDEGITAPPVDQGKGVVETPKNEDENMIFTKVEIESFFTGGDAAWQRFLYKNFHYPDDAINSEIQGTVIVKFVVDKEGNISDVQAESGPTEGGLREEAIRVIKKSSGMWKPAIQNGRQVKSYKRQPIIFKLQDQ